MQDTVVRRDIALSENEVRDGKVAANSYIYFIYIQKVIQLFISNIISWGNVPVSSVNKIV